ncbi:DUF3053 family protein [Escherichia coli]
MRSGERLPTLTADQKKQFGPFVSDCAIGLVILAGESGGWIWLRPVVHSVNAIRVPQDYVTKAVRCVNERFAGRGATLQNGKLQADAAHPALKKTR